MDIYRQAKKLTQKTGILHEVDHIIPLQNHLVCGLHVENNLQILTREQNRKKFNHFESIIK
jgi:5-methylcytosine-specific restriction endonuclease McrA